MREKRCMYAWLMNAKFTSFKLPSFMKLSLIVCLCYMVLQTRLAELLSNHISYLCLSDLLYW